MLYRVSGRSGEALGVPLANRNQLTRLGEVGKARGSDKRGLTRTGRSRRRRTGRRRMGSRAGGRRAAGCKHEKQSQSTELLHVVIFRQDRRQANEPKGRG